MALFFLLLVLLVLLHPSTTQRANEQLYATKSIPVPLNPHAAKPLPQLSRPARSPTDALLPFRVFLPVAHGSRLPFDAHRATLGGGRGHFDGVGVAFGRVAGVELVLLEGPFDGVGGLAFAFEVVGVVLLRGIC